MVPVHAQYTVAAWGGNEANYTRFSTEMLEFLVPIVLLLLFWFWCVVVMYNARLSKHEVEALCLTCRQAYILDCSALVIRCISTDINSNLKRGSLEYLIRGLNC